jgi:hypothetical protein
MKIRAEISEIEKRKTTEKINKGKADLERSVKLRNL